MRPLDCHSPPSAAPPGAPPQAPARHQMTLRFVPQVT